MKYEAFASVIGRPDPIEAESPEAAALRAASRYALPDGAVVLIGYGGEVAGAFRVILERRVEQVDEIGDVRASLVQRKAVPVRTEQEGGREA